MVVPSRSCVHADQVQAALKGDPTALQDVVRDWLPTIYGWCARLGAGRIDSEEAAHDVMMTFLRRHATVHGPERLPAWLFGTCRRVVANRRRSAWLRRWLPGATLDDRHAPDRSDAATESREQAEAVLRTLDQLSDAHREVLVLCYLEERSVAEAGELLGIPSGTVKSRLFAARQQFRAHFEGTP
ncbi:MAG: sigma-70 family RNA polymerase sigma factor [Myxococcales bacterium]|nr:sigma-70 family RNA polymerase sigma factor [Myxococcales bacterium]